MATKNTESETEEQVEVSPAEEPEALYVVLFSNVGDYYRGAVAPKSKFGLHFERALRIGAIKLYDPNETVPSLSWNRNAPEPGAVSAVPAEADVAEGEEGADAGPEADTQ